MTGRRSRHDSHADRLLRARVLEAPEGARKQFKSYEGIWPFRIPHEPLALADIVDEALGDGTRRSRLTSRGHGQARDLLRSRTVWKCDGRRHVWTAWAIALPGIIVYCDDDGDEARVLASVKRGNPFEADGFFLELLAETRGQAFGMEMSGGAPESRANVRSPIAISSWTCSSSCSKIPRRQAPFWRDRRADARDDAAKDFRADVEHWLTRTLGAATGSSIAPPSDPPTGRRTHAVSTFEVSFPLDSRRSGVQPSEYEED